MADLKAYMESNVIEAGCDEAGRGCLAGAVFAASVILPPDFSDPLLNDSKKLNEKQRNTLRELICKEAISYSVASIDEAEIDKINILNASIKAMHMALDALLVKPQHIIVDGNRFKPYKNIAHKCVVKGDGKYFSIAAASVLAKTFRDDYITELSKEYPQYNWHKNKSYGTLDHRNAILTFGATPHHRKTFLKNILSTQLNLFESK